MIVERIPLSNNPAYNHSDVSLHVRVDGIADFVGEIDRMAQAAVAELENYAQIALLYQTIRITLPFWNGSHRMFLPIGPVTLDAAESVMAGGEVVEGVALLPGLRPELHFTRDLPTGPVVIEYRAGYGPDHLSIPHDLKNAVSDQVAALFDQKGAGDGKSNGMSVHMARVAARYRRVRL